MRQIRLLLVDDHELIRAGNRSLLQNCADFEVVAEAANGRVAIELVEKLQPHVVLMDVMMPEMNGLDATARIVASWPNVRVIILSMNSAEEYVLQSLRSGAAGYLLKDVNPVELEQAVRTVARGEMHLTPAISRHVVAGFLNRAEGGSTSLERLTPRQREVLQLVAEGNSTKEIASKLGISVKTAEAHRGQLMDSLEIHDIAGLVRYAIRTGVITPDK